MATPDHPQRRPAAEVAPASPSVLVVMVAHQPGPWFEESLRGLADQDYPRLSVLVVDTAGYAGLAERVHAVLPQATVRSRPSRRPGFGAAANMVLDEGHRAALYLFCHDDVCLRADAVSRLVEELIRSNAGVVGPKLVDWDDPSRLQHVGLGVDKFAVAAPLAEEGELDQAQHDSVTDVFAVHSAAMMVRADLFGTIGGFDPGISFRNDDVDLCWRAQLAGARVLVVPAAVARHRERLNERREVDDVRRLRMRHQLRTTAVCYRLGRLAVVLPQAALLALVEILLALAQGRLGQARDVAGAWTWNLRRVGAVARRRRQVRRYRQLSDAQLRQAHLAGSARLRAFVRGQIGRGDVGGIAGAGRQVVASVRAPAVRGVLAAGVLLALVVGVGTRHLLTQRIPAIGELQPLEGGTGQLLAEWWRGWRTEAFGTSAPAPSALALLGVLGVPLFGNAGLLRTVVVLAPLPVGAIGAWRLLRPFGSLWTQMVATVVYVSVPVALNGYARGSFGALVAFAAAPWLLGALARTLAVRPYVRPGRGGSVLHRALALGLLVAVAAALAPALAAVALVVVAGLVLGSLVAGDGRGIGRLLGATAGAGVVAAVLHLPWSATFVRSGATWSSFAGVGQGGGAGPSVGDLLRFHTGPHGASALGYGAVLLAAVPLLVAQGPRLSWAIRAWFVALGCFGIAFADGQGWLPHTAGDPGVVLAPAAAAVALAAGLGMAAFEQDLRRHRFGWRQLAPGTALVAMVATVLPLLGAAGDGRWDMPRRDLHGTYQALVEREEHSSRILWIGDPRVLPVTGFDLDGRVGFTATLDRAPRFTDRWGAPDTAAVPLVREVLSLAMAGDTHRLGRLLAPFGVRHVVVVRRIAPAPGEQLVIEPPAALTRALAAQLDLQRIDGVNEALLVYRNEAAAPVRSAVAPGVDEPVAAGGILAASAIDLTGYPPALTDVAADNITARGPVPAGAEVYVATSAAEEWRLEVGGAAAPRRDAFGWANAFAVPEAGDAELSYRTPVRRRALLGAQVGLWVVAWVALGEARQWRRPR